MYQRDLLLGLLLLVGGSWIAFGGAVASDGVALGVAVGGCALAGVVYLFSAVEFGVGRRIAGRTLTRLRLRAVAQSLLGASMLALGINGYVETGSGSPLLAVAGVGVLGLAAVLWTRPEAADGGHDGE